MELVLERAYPAPASTSSGRFAMESTARATSFASIVGSIAGESLSIHTF
jgi:hypothetical protein